MTAPTNIRRTQSGAYLLEALIGILIFSFGILGIVGLQAQAIRFTNDAEIRAEAMYLANSLISQMWTDNPAVLQTNYSSPSGAAYVDFRDNKVAPALQGAMNPSLPPVVIVNGPSLPPPPSKSSISGVPASVVQITIYWQLPGDPVQHNYTTTGVIAQN